jgi:hypothetical protein
MMNAFHPEVPLPHRGISVSVVLAEAARLDKLSADQDKCAGCRAACFISAIEAAGWFMLGEMND